MLLLLLLPLIFPTGNPMHMHISSGGGSPAAYPHQRLHSTFYIRIYISTLDLDSTQTTQHDIFLSGNIVLCSMFDKSHL